MFKLKYVVFSLLDDGILLKKPHEKISVRYDGYFVDQAASLT